MAAQFESVSTSSWGTGSTVTITKPTGLAVGDLMVVFLGGDGTDSANPTAKSGWSDLNGTLDAMTRTGSVNALRRGIQWRIATQSDVDATNFVWTVQSGVTNGGSIVRISGHSPTTPIGAWNQATAANTVTPSWANTITPPANSLLLMVIGVFTNGGASAGSNYAITTSNPTWTERVDTGSGDAGNIIATASRPESTGTGNSSASITSTENGNTLCYLIAIQPPVPNYSGFFTFFR